MSTQKTEHRSQCPIARSLDLFGDKWTLVIMRDVLFFKRRTYGEFSRSGEHIPTNLLADRLKRLVANGILEQVPYQDRPPRYRYEPTEKGRALKPVLQAMARFGENHLEGPRSER